MTKKLPNNVNISVIIVTYNSEKVIENCLGKINETLKGAVLKEIIMVDNASQDKTVSLARRFSDVVVLKNLKNLGFAQAVNRGVAQAKGESIILLNADVFINQSLEGALNYLKKHPETGVVGGKLIKNGKIQPHICGFEYSLARLIAGKFGLGKKPWCSENPLEVDWVTGALMVFRKKTFNRVGGFDGRFFMFFEDQDFCLRVKEAGNTVVYLPRVTALHLHGKSSNQAFSKLKSYYYNSENYFFKKHRSRLETLLMRFFRLPFKLFL